MPMLSIAQAAKSMCVWKEIIQMMLSAFEAQARSAKPAGEDQDLRLLRHGTCQHLGGAGAAAEQPSLGECMGFCKCVNTCVLQRVMHAYGRAP